jgi:hypothetical protein
MLPSLDQRGWSTRSRSYQAINRAHEIFQRRINEIETQLAGAFEEISILDGRIESHERRLALCMAHHPRLGKDSWLSALPNDLLISITSEASGAL